MDALSQEIPDRMEPRVSRSDRAAQVQEIHTLSQRFSRWQVWHHQARWLGVRLVWRCVVQLSSGLKRGGRCCCCTAAAHLPWTSPVCHWAYREPAWGVV
jgi:hypothetical protein